MPRIQTDLSVPKDLRNKSFLFDKYKSFVEQPARTQLFISAYGQS